MELTPVQREVATRDSLKLVRSGWKIQSMKHAPGYATGIFLVSFKNPTQHTGESYDTVTKVLHGDDLLKVNEAQAEHEAASG